MINISELKESINAYIQGDISFEEAKKNINKAGEGGRRINSDIDRWRRDVEGYNAFADDGGVTKFDRLWHGILRLVNIRKPFSSREIQLIKECQQMKYQDYLIAYLLSRTLQEVRLEIETLKES